MYPHNQATWGFAKLAAVAGALLVAAGMTGAFGDGTAPDPDLTTLFSVSGNGAAKGAGKLAARRPARPGVVGVVADRVGPGLLIVPFGNDPAFLVKATRQQRQRCPVRARYPDCLQER